MEYGILVFREFRMTVQKRMLCGSLKNGEAEFFGEDTRMMAPHMMFITGQMVMDRPTDIFQK